MAHAPWMRRCWSPRRRRRPERQRAAAAALARRLAGALLARQGQAGALHQRRGRRAGCRWRDKLRAGAGGLCRRRLAGGGAHHALHAAGRPGRPGSPSTAGRGSTTPASWSAPRCRRTATSTAADRHCMGAAGRAPPTPRPSAQLARLAARRSARPMPQRLATRRRCPTRALPSGAATTAPCWPAASSRARPTLVGLYDVHTRPAVARAGPGHRLCVSACLRMSASEGATIAYLQVDADNDAARTHLPAPGLCRRLRLPLPAGPSRSGPRVAYSPRPSSTPRCTFIALHRRAAGALAQVVQARHQDAPGVSLAKTKMSTRLRVVAGLHVEEAAFQRAPGRAAACTRMKRSPA